MCGVQKYFLLAVLHNEHEVRNVDETGQQGFSAEYQYGMDLLQSPHAVS